MTLIDIDKSKFSADEKTMFRQLNPKTIQLFYSSIWPKFAYQYLEETNKDYLNKLDLFLDTQEFYDDVATIGKESYTLYLNTQIDAEKEKYEEILPQNFQGIVNTIKLEASEVAQGEIKKYIEERINS